MGTESIVFGIRVVRNQRYGQLLVHKCFGKHVGRIHKRTGFPLQVDIATEKTGINAKAEGLFLPE